MLGTAVWGLFTSVRFAVIQITAIVLAALVGMTIHQLPAFAIGPNATPADYANAMAAIHAQYDPALGVSVTDLFERLGFFRVFSTAWFGGLLVLLFLSILVCTIDRLPRLWREVRAIHVAQPEAYFDPRLPGRARFEAGAWDAGAGASATPGETAESIRAVLRRNHFRVRRETAGETVFLYGDRHQYTKLATLITHAGLLLFILGAAVSSVGIPFLGLFPAEVPIVLAQDQTQTIQPIGTPDLLVVKNLGFSAPLDAQGRPLDYTTDLAIYQNGVQVARKVIRVNDPLSYGGYTFHQNFTGPAADLDIRDPAGNPLWTGPLPLDDAPIGGHSTRQLVVPGHDVSLELILFNEPTGDVLAVNATRQSGVDAQGQPKMSQDFFAPLRIGDTYKASADGFDIRFNAVSAYTGLIARRDPGEYIVWLAFGCLILGLLITFYLPRRRIWLRLERGGQLSVTARSDRYVAFEREYGRLLEDLAELRSTA